MLPFPSPGDLPDLGIKPGSSALQADFFYHLNHQGSPYCFSWHIASSFQIKSDERWYSANVYFIEERSAFTLG